MKDFIFLENHSVYSMCEGTIFISDLVKYAKSHNFSYLSICDTNGFYGIVNFIHASRNEGLKPIISVKLKDSFFNGILVARNMRGYSKICYIISQTHLNNNFDVKRVIIKDNSEDYFVITDDKNLLLAKKKNIYSEINVLKKDYYRDYSFARKHKVKPVLIYPVYFLKKEDYHFHLLLRAIHFNKKLSSLSTNEVQTKDSYPIEINEIFKKYSFMEDAIKNTKKIAENSLFDFNMKNNILPKYCENSFSTLKNICIGNIKKRYGHATKDILDRLERELSIIDKKGLFDFFLIVHDIVKRSPCTCGRGSAASSIVSYLLFITHVDPIKHNLFFERFLNESRPDYPDIDVDFPWDKRDEILNYIFKKYSAKNTSMVSNHITFSARSSIREIAKVYGIPENEIIKITNNVGCYYDRHSDDLAQFSKYKNNSSLWKRVYQKAVRINSIPRYLSVHCGGIVITQKPVYYYIPIEKAMKGVNIIQLEKDQAEDFGFIKIDVLGNRSLSVVRDALNLINNHYSKLIPYEDLNPLNDKKTTEMLRDGNTIGVFYVESPAMRQLQKKTGKGDYKHLVIHSSIIRPAANVYIKEYIKRLKGKPYKSPLPELDNILKETYGIMCYQEDITKIAIKIADFPISEASELRRIISKKNKAKRRLELKEKFYKNLESKNIKNEIIDNIWSMIESFSGYSFCKPHSASYALLSFKACYLKAHYPAEFMGAVLKNQGGYYTPLAYISEARRLSLKVIPPDINLSKNEYFGSQDTVYIGFMQIKNLSEGVIKKLIEEREKNGRYLGLIDFMKRTNAGLNDTTILIKSGCFKNLEHYNQPQLLYMAHKFFSSKNLKNLETLYSNTSLDILIAPPPMKDITYEQKIKNELEIFGFIVSIHPMNYYRESIKDKDVVYAKDLSLFVNRFVKVAGILITAKTVLTKNNELMQFISFEDETAIFETIFFPKPYKKFALMLSNQRPYILYGKVESEFNVISLNVYNIEYVAS